MQKSKLVDIFYSLTPHEKIGFKKLVYSPIYNKQVAVCQLLDYIYSLDFNKDRSKLDRKKVYSFLFGATKFNMSKLRYVFSELTKLLEQYLVLEYRKKNALAFQLDLSRAYQERNLSNYSQQSLAHAQKLYKKQPLKDIKQLDWAYQIEWAAYENASSDRSNSQNLQALNDSFDNRYIAEKLKHSCRILSYQGMYTQQYNTGLLDTLILYLQKHEAYLEEPAIALYYYYYQASTNQEEGDLFFKKFKTCLLEYQNYFEKKEIQDLYKLATNYSIKRLNTDQRAYYLQETFELYQQTISQEILLVNQQISPFAFTNIVAISLGLKKYDWTWDFIQNYQNYLPKNIQQAYRDYNLSRWYFHQKAYNKAAELLVADDFEDLHLNLSAKMLLLKIYYELGEFQLLEALTNRFKTYLSRKKALVYHKKNYNNILRFTQRLVNINPFSKKAKEKLQRDIEATELLTEKDWLLEQLGDL